MRKFKLYIVIGYYSIAELKDALEIASITLEKGFWLEHMFIEPNHLGAGIGTLLFKHLHKRCISRGINQVKILVDPNARGFYDKMGCVYQKDYPSTINNRTTPLLHCHIYP